MATLQQLVNNQSSILSNFTSKINDVYTKSDIDNKVTTLSRSIAVVAEDVEESLSNLDVYTKNETNDMIYSYTQQNINRLVGNAPANLDTLGELATAINRINQLVVEHEMRISQLEQ